MGSCVITGITFTKFVGVVVLAWAPSTLFRLYYFRMYVARARMLLFAPTILRTRRSCRLFACSK
jgi:Niemann-Pick C1 protein